MRRFIQLVPQGEVLQLVTASHRYSISLFIIFSELVQAANYELVTPHSRSFFLGLRTACASPFGCGHRDRGARFLDRKQEDMADTERRVASPFAICSCSGTIQLGKSLRFEVVRVRETNQSPCNTVLSGCQWSSPLPILNWPCGRRTVGMFCGTI